MLKTKKPRRKTSWKHTRKKTSEIPSTSKQQNSNLCNTCNNENDCTLSSSDTTILYCEEFDNSSTSQRQAIKTDVPTEKSIIHYEQHLGLCTNCVHKDTCSLSKTEGGVWHCEEYD